MHLKPFTKNMLAMLFVFCSSSIFANITNYKFYAGQAFDAQREPAFPTANSLFTLSFFREPFTMANNPYSLNDKEYIQIFFVNGTCKDGLVGINRYNAQDQLIETVQASGHIYGLAPEGFLHDNGHNIGTFIMTHPLVSNSVTYIPTTGPEPETCSRLEEY